MNGLRLSPMLALALVASLCFSNLHARTSGDDALRKLDVRARAAYRVDPAHRLDTTEGDPSALSVAGDLLDVFIVGDPDVRALEALGVRVRTRLPRLVTAFIPRSVVLDVAARSDVEQICGARPLEPVLDVSIPAVGVDVLRGAGPAFDGLNGAGVLVGTVDTGIDLDHDDFRNPDGTTRIVSVWDQTSSVGSPPAGFSYGTEWTRADIDAGVATEQDPGSHGSHVMGIAAGDGSATSGTTAAFTYAGVAPRADIAAVQLLVDALFDTRVIDGVAYLFDVAAARGQPAVVNLSLSSQFGPHDGTSPLEAGISALTGPGRIVCVAAGNFGGLPWHAEARSNEGSDTVVVHANVSSTGEMFWTDGYYDDGEILSVTLETPDSTIIGPLLFGQESDVFPGTATGNGLVYLWHGDYAGSNEVYFQVEETPGTSLLGDWTLTFVPTPAATHGEIDLWHANTGYPNINSGFTEGAQPDEETITEPGNAFNVITVGAWVTKPTYLQCNLDVGSVGGELGKIASFSSAGPTRDGRLKPDVCAPGLGVASSLSNDSGLSCPPPGNSTRIVPSLEHSIATGTSMSAPHVAGVAALAMQKFGPVDAVSIQNLLQLYSISDEHTGGVPNHQWGHGKLDASALLWLTSTEVSVDAQLRLEPFQPNPSASLTRVAFRASASSFVKLEILDLRGRVVRRLHQGPIAAGTHSRMWDGKDMNGASVSAGVYIVRLSGPTESVSQKVTVLR